MSSDHRTEREAPRLPHTSPQSIRLTWVLDLPASADYPPVFSYRPMKEIPSGLNVPIVDYIVYCMLR